MVIDVRTSGKWIALREGDIDRSIPFGIASYSTVAGVRKIEWRPVDSAGRPVGNTPNCGLERGASR